MRISSILAGLVLLAAAGCNGSRPAPQPAPSDSRPTQSPSRQEVLEAHFLAIRDMDFSWGNVGSVAEALGFIRLARDYPAPRYEVLAGLQYHDATGRTLGELDLVVWSLVEKQAVYVYEVKVSRNLERAGRKARAQLGRFRAAVAAGNVARFTYGRDPDRRFTAGRFGSVKAFRLLGSKGCKAAGWDVEVDLTREEADILQARVLAYRKGR